MGMGLSLAMLSIFDNLPSLIFQFGNDIAHLLKRNVRFKHVAGQIYSVEVGFVIPFSRVVHRRKCDNFKSTLNDLKRARQSYFAFSSKITLTISIMKRNLWIIIGSALLNKTLNLLALLIGHSKQKQARVNREC